MPDEKRTPSFLAGGSRMGSLIEAHNWAATSLGPIESWPQSLKTAVDIMLTSPAPVSILWGPDHVQLYNDAYVPIAAERHPAALGRPAAVNWPEAFDEFLNPIIERAFAGGTVAIDQHVVQLRKADGSFEDRLFTGTFSPVRDDIGRVGGVFHPLIEVTAQVRADAELRESEAQLRSVLDGMGESFALLDHEFRIIGMNAEALRMEERPLADILGKTHWEAHPNADPALTDLFRKAMAERVPLDLEHRYAWPDGRVTWLSVRAYPVAAGLAVFYGDVTERRTAEEAIRESEARFRNMADHAPVMMWMTDATGRCTYLNTRWYEYTGQTRAEAEGFGWLEATHPDDKASAEQVFLNANAARAPFRLEYRLRRADGAYRWAINAAAPRFDDEGAFFGYVGSVVDIDERREIEDRLRELNVNLERKVTERALARSRTWAVSPEIMGVINSEGYFEQSNPAWASVLGWSEEEIARTVFFDFIHPNDLAKTQKAWADAIEQGAPALRFENRYRHKNGGWRWLSWVAVPDDGKVYCSAREITAEKEQEVALAERTAERDRMWETSPDLMLIIDFEGVFRRVNPAWTTVLGYSPEELVGRHVNEFVIPDDHGETIDAYELAAAGGRPVVENRYWHKDGSIRWVSWTAAPAGELTYATGRDITLEKERKAELKAAQEALRQSQKMEAMGSLTGGVAHDFNNLLTPIIGSLDMLVRKGVGSERERRLIDGALQSAERAKTLVQRLLAFARRQPLQPTAVDVGRLVDGMVGLIGSTLGPAIDIRVHLSDDLPPAKADPNQLEMAILNLAVNARDAMPDGGVLTIAAQRVSVRGGHKANLRPGHYVRLGVRDTGAGMDEATVQRAIEPFFSTKGVGKGTGLGLSMVHGLTAQLGGGLTIESAPGQGTVIELWFPISATAIGEEKEMSAAPPPRLGRGTALLVDDEELVRMSTADMLVDLGFQVMEAGSAEEALRLIKSGTTPDLLVTDHLMPGMNGAELAREVRTLHPAVPILVVSGYAEAEGVAPELPRLTKPFRNAELAASLLALVPAAAG